VNATLYPPPSSPKPLQRKLTLGVDPCLGSPHGDLQHRTSSPLMHRPSMPLLGGPDGRPGTPKKKIMQSQGDWRRRILGDITVMNQDEVSQIAYIMHSNLFVQLQASNRTM
jgi:hypothetical protein